MSDNVEYVLRKSDSSGFSQFTEDADLVRKHEIEQQF